MEADVKLLTAAGAISNAGLWFHRGRHRLSCFRHRQKIPLIPLCKFPELSQNG